MIKPLALVLALAAGTACAQVQTTWVNQPGGVSVARDAADNVYTAHITVPNRCLGRAGPDSALEKLLTWLRLPRYRTHQVNHCGDQNEDRDYQ